MRLFSALMIHCAAAVIATEIPILRKIVFRAEKFTLPSPMMQSIASPMRIGTYSVNATVTTASKSVNTKAIGYFPT